jgi:hypothetical protein
MKFIVLLLAVCAVAIGTHGRLWSIPDRHNPWATLQYSDPPNWVTGYKLSRLKRDPSACHALLASTPWRFETVIDRVTGPGCGFQDALLVRRTLSHVNANFTLSCPAAASLALWERHVLHPQALAHPNSPIRRIDHFGSYACRNVAGRETERRSQHATADALDIAGFVLEDGRRIAVVTDWTRSDAPGEFLRAAHKGACGLFDGVLGPEYNQAHSDHFHFDRGPYRICR